MYEMNEEKTTKNAELTMEETENKEVVSIEENTEKKAEKNKKKRTPTQKKTAKRIRCGVAVALAVGTFAVGFFTGRMALDPELRTLMKIKTTIQGAYYEKVTDEEFYGVLFDAVNRDLLDAYSYYITAEEYEAVNADAKGERSGIGVDVLTQDEQGNAQIFVAGVRGNSPAETAGLTAGDYIVGWGVTEDSFVESTIFDEFSAFLAERKTNENFYIRVKKGDNERVLTIAKRYYVESYVFYRAKDVAYRFTGNNATELSKGGEPLACLDEKTAYIRLTQFNGVAAKEFSKTMKRFREDGMKNLVLDLRGNGGGYLDIMQEIAAYFCKTSDAKKPVVAIADYGERKEKYKATGNYYDDYFDKDSRICVLADNQTASASECLIGCMIDYGATAYSDICISERLGEVKTFGKGIMQTTYPFLFTGDAMKLTTAVIVWPKSNHCIHGRGILPEDGVLSVAESYEDDVEITQAIEKLFS